MSRRAPEIPQTAAEELANSVTHGIGAALALAGLAVLVVLAARAGDPWRIVSFSIYGASLVTLYLASTLYHGFRSPRVKRIFHVLDHSSIYLLIAGTYTPVTLVSLRGPWGWTLFGVIWGLAIAGVVFKCFFTGRFDAASTAIYVAMGWLAVVAVRPAFRALGGVGLLFIAAGGLAYTLGVVFYAWRRLPFGHSIWHLFVVAGSALHFVAVVVYVRPVR